MSTSTPIGLHHEASKDIQLAGYNFPKVRYHGLGFSTDGFCEDALCKWNIWMLWVSKLLSKYERESAREQLICSHPFVDHGVWQNKNKWKHLLRVG